MAGEYIAGTKAATTVLGHVCVLGLGKSGKSVVRYLVGQPEQRVRSVFVAAGARTDDSAAFLESFDDPRLSYAFGDDALEGREEGFNLCVASPGIPYWHPLYIEGKRLSDELVGEVGFAWRQSAADSLWVAITGTNGKTTTTDLCAHILQEAGYAARAVGNIGDVCLDAVAQGGTDIYVAEVSSYQLASCPMFSPDVMLMLGITPDHIHWHRTFEAYRDAKFRVLDNMAVYASVMGQISGVAVLDATNEVVRQKVRALRAQSLEQRRFRYIPLGTAEGIHGDMRARCGADNAAFLDGSEMLTVAFEGCAHRLCPAGDLPVPGPHNIANALMAASACIALGVPDEAIAAGLRTFALLPHRLEPCGEVAGVEFVNDSKATNVDATLKALESFPGRRLVVLLGGDDKDTDLSELVACTHRRAAAAVCFGAAGPRFFEAFQAQPAPDGFRCCRAGLLEEALDAAIGLAEPGDIVLLSPACASFDQFSSFEQRGDVFKSLVSIRTQG